MYACTHTHTNRKLSNIWAASPILKVNPLQSKWSF